MNNSRVGRVVTSHRGQIASVPLLKQPGLSLVLAPGPFRRTLMGYVQDLAGQAVVCIEASRRHCCVLIDEFDAGAAEVTIGAAMFRVEATHMPVIRSALRC